MCRTCGSFCCVLRQKRGLRTDYIGFVCDFGRFGANAANISQASIWVDCVLGETEMGPKPHNHATTHIDRNIALFQPF